MAERRHRNNPSFNPSTSGGPDEITRFLRNYNIPPNAIHNLHNLQVSAEAFSLQPAEILRVIGLLDELEIHTIANDWREYRAKGYSPSYIDRLLLAEFHRSSTEKPPSQDLDNGEDHDIIEPPSTSLLDLSSSLLLSPSLNSAVNTPVSKPSLAISPSNKDASNRSIPPSNSKTVTFSSNLEMTAPITPHSPKSLKNSKERQDLIDAIQELRSLVEQRSVENDYLRLQYNSQVEDVERRAKEYKEIRDECKEWKQAKQIVDTQLMQTEAARAYLQTELDDTLKIMVEKNLMLCTLQEELSRYQLQIQTLQEQAQRKPQSDAIVQYDPSIQQSVWSIVSSDIISIDPDPNLILAPTNNQYHFVNGSEISTINEDDDLLMSGEIITSKDGKNATSLNVMDSNYLQSEEKIPTIDEEIDAVAETVDIGIVTNCTSLNNQDKETDTLDLNNGEDIVLNINLGSASKTSKTKTVDDLWENLSYAELLQKYRTLEDESTVWQQKQYQDLIDSESEVRRLEMLLSEKEKDCQGFQDKYDRLLRSSMSEINETALQEKAKSEELIATLQGQREGYLGKIIQLQELLEQKEAIITQKDKEIVRLQALIRNGGRDMQEPSFSRISEEKEKGLINSRLPANITEGRSISLPLVASSHVAISSITETSKEKPLRREKIEENEEEIDMVETWSRERLRDKVAHEEHQERQRWEEKEKLYLINIDYLSASLRELTTAFHEQQHILQKISPVPNNHNENFSSNFNLNKAMTATASSDPQRYIQSSKAKPTPPNVLQQQQQQQQENTRPRTSHGYAPTAASAAAISGSVRSSTFPHKHRAIKSASRRDPSSLVSPSIVEDTSRKHVQNCNQRDSSPRRDEKLFYSDNEPSVDGKNSDIDEDQEGIHHDHIMFLNHVDRDRSISPLTVNEQDRKKLEKEQKDALLKKAYDSESLKQIYFHYVNKNPRPLTGNLYSAIQKSQQASAPTKSRPTSSSSARQSKDTRKSTKPRPRSSLVANFIQGLEMRYNEDLARLIHDQQEENATFYDQLATSVGKVARGNVSGYQTNNEASDQDQSHINATARQTTIQNANKSTVVSGSSSRSNKSENRTNNHQQHAVVQKAPENEHEEDELRGSHGGGFFVTVVPSSSVAPQTARVVPKLPLHQRAPAEFTNANSDDFSSSNAKSSNIDQCGNDGMGKERSSHRKNMVNQEVVPVNSGPQMSVGQQNNQSQYIPHQHPHNHYRHYSSSSAPATIVSTPTKGQNTQVHEQFMHDTEPLTSYPIQYQQMPSVSSVASSTVFSSQLPSQLSSPSMVLHPSNSEPQEEFFAQNFHHYHSKR